MRAISKVIVHNTIGRSLPLGLLDTPLSSDAVKIINPLPGGMRYTCRPEHFVRLGLAEMQQGKLYFLGRSDEAFIGRDKIFWNGSQGENKMHRPGEVRS